MEGREKPAGSRDGFSADKRALFALLVTQEGLTGAGNQRVTRRRVNEPVPLSFPQQRLWLNERLAPGAAYNVAAVLRLDGMLRVDALENALSELFRRHESLRTTFVMKDDGPVQVIGAPTPVRVPLVDLRSMPPVDREAEAQRLAACEAREPFDLARSPLVRVSLLQLGANSHRLLITMHHIVSDGWSTAVFIRELTALYGLAVQGKPVRLDDPPIQYADFALWQRDQLKTDVLDRQLAFWRQHLAEASALISLPTDRPRPAALSSRGSLHRFTWPRGLLDDVRAFSRHEDVTVFMTLLAAFQTLLNRYSGETDLLIGTPVANRSRPELEGIIGFFVNTLVLRGDLSGDPTFRELLKRTRETCLAAYAHQDLPFERLVEALAPPRDRAYTPVFQIMFALQNAPAAHIVLPDLDVTIEDGDTASTAFDLTLSIRESEEGLAGSFEYRTDLFDDSTIARMLVHLEMILRDSLARPEQRISALRLLTPRERHQVLAEWNASAAPARSAPDVLERIAAHAERAPTAIAVVCGEERVSYATLEERASRLAHALRRLGVGREVRVGVYLERSVDLVVGMLAILKAGGAFVPIDPAYPALRVSFMLEDAQATVILTTARLAGQLAGCKAHVTCVDSENDDGAGADTAACEWDVRPEQLAYVVYTSGSTGRPKGVMVERGVLARYIETARLAYRLDSSDVCLQFASPSFDTSVEEIFSCLVAGGRLMLRSDAMIASIGDFLAQCDAWRVTILNLPTSYWHEIVASWPSDSPELPPTVRLVIFGGERARRPHLSLWQQRSAGAVVLLNTYGPTETTVVATMADVSTANGEGPEDEVPIGRPISHVRIYVLDQHGEPVPVGVPGEIYIGGAGVARGYWQRPDLTAERFVPDSFGAAPGARLYRTGDRGRYVSDGRLVFLGRSDAQVKVRGHRIELGEIEAGIRAHQAIEDAVVLLQEEDANARIVAYVVPAAGSLVTLEALRSFLRETLPAYSVPSTFVFLDSLPKSASGKIDRRALGAANIPSQLYEPPRGPTEEVLASIWMDVMQLERVGAHDNFFELGGHSLLAMRVQVRVQGALGIDLPMARLFEHPTVAGLAEYVDAEKVTHGRAIDAPIVAVSHHRPMPLSVAQEELWRVDRRFPNTPLFNIPVALRLTGTLDRTALERAINEVVQRHETLRTTFAATDGRVSQIVAPTLALTLTLTDLGDVPKARQEVEVRRLTAMEAYRPFDLGRGPLVRAGVLVVGPLDCVLLLTLHHIVADGWSIDVLTREIEALYDSYLSGTTPSLPDLPIQYADFAAWQRHSLQSGVWEDQFAFWKQRLGGPLPIQQLPADRPESTTTSFDTARQPVTLSSELIATLRELSSGEASSLFMLVLAAFKLVMWSLKEQSEIRVATQIANRTRAEMEPLIGLFINTLVLRTDLSGNPSFRDLLGRVRQTTLEAFARQDLPFEIIVERLQGDADFDAGALSRVLFLWENLEGKALRLPGTVAEPGTLSSPLADLGLTPTTCDLVVVFGEGHSGVSGYVTYKTDRFEAGTIRHLVHALQNVLASIATDPDRRLVQFSEIVQAGI
jgi:amino acid adenylation domain-containing protein